MTVSAICMLMLVLRTQQSGCSPCHRAHTSPHQWYQTLGMSFLLLPSLVASLMAGIWAELYAALCLVCWDLFNTQLVSHCTVAADPATRIFFNLSCCTHDALRHQVIRRYLLAPVLLPTYLLLSSQSVPPFCVWC